MDDLSKFFPSVWQTPFQRSLATFEAYLKGDQAARYFEKDFIEGLLSEQKRQVEKFQKAFSLSLLLAVALAFFDRLTSLNFDYQGVKFAELRSFEPLILAFMSLSFMASIFAAMDMLICGQLVRRIFNSAGIFSASLFFANKFSDELWLDGLTPRYFGAMSGSAHKSAFVLVGLLMFLIVALLVSIPAVVCLVKTWEAYFVVPRFTMDWWLYLLSVGITVYAVMCFLTVFVVRFRFKNGFLEEGRPVSDAVNKEKLETLMAVQAADAASRGHKNKP